MEYNQAEWDALGLGADPGWTKDETEYLFSLCRQYDLRFNVIADRYSYIPPPGVGADGQPLAPVQRSVHELKGRYYFIAHALVSSRADARDEVAHKEIIKHPFNPGAEAERRELLSALLTRTAGADAEEEALLSAAAAVEAKRKAEVEAAKAAGLPLPAYCRPSGRFPELTLELGEIDPSADPGGPELLTPRGVSIRPPPGAYVRGIQTIVSAQEGIMLQVPSRFRDKKAAEAFNRRLELAMEELGVRTPHVASRAVCRAWAALRKETAELLEVRESFIRSSIRSNSNAACV